MALEKQRPKDGITNFV